MPIFTRNPFFLFRMCSFNQSKCLFALSSDRKIHPSIGRYRRVERVTILGCNKRNVWRQHLRRIRARDKRCGIIVGQFVYYKRHVQGVVATL
jgi:hypothetical protein